jgi:hypothetical protein
LVHPKQRRALGAAARHRVVELFSAKRSFQTYRKMYEQLGARRSADTPPRGIPAIIDLSAPKSATMPQGKQLPDPEVLA